MKSPLVLGMLFAGGLVLAGAFFLKSRWMETQPPPATRETANAGPSLAPPEAEAIASPPRATSIPTNSVAAPESPSEAVQAEVERLEQLGLKDDSSSLSDILQALTSSEPEIRQAAREAARQFGSTNAIPALKAAAESAPDLKEKIDFLETADFLALPPANFDGVPVSLTPEQQQAEEQKQARRQLRKQARQSARQPAAPDSPVAAPASPPGQPQ